jgi:hypothetical protein
VAGALRRISGAIGSRSVDPYAVDHWTRLAVFLERAERLHPGQRRDYTWGVLHAADIARHQGIRSISVLELGVAGGNSLVALERAAVSAGELLGVEVEVHGFDTGTGLPPPRDHRDAPYVARERQFAMDEPALRRRLRRTNLHIADVADAIPEFIASSPPPVGFAALDLDYYSSTVDALTLLDAPHERLMPRVLLYVDDSLGYPWGDSNGPRLAIREFNDSREGRAIDHLAGMRHHLPQSELHARWPEALYLAHVYDHPRYADDDGTTFGPALGLVW